MNKIQRDAEGKVIVPKGMVYVATHTKRNRRGEGITVPEFLRRKHKKVSLISKILSIFRR